MWEYLILHELSGEREQDAPPGQVLCQCFPNRRTLQQGIVIQEIHPT